MIELRSSPAVISLLDEILNVFVLLAVVINMIYPYTLHRMQAIVRGKAVHFPGDRGFKLNQGG